MTIPTRIIEKAVEGGFLPSWQYDTEFVGNGGGVWIQLSKGGEIARLAPATILLDPLFWQALENSLGWFGEWSREYWTDRDDEFFAEGLSRMGTTERMIPPWRWYSQRLYDLILTGGDTDAFWEGIMP